MYGKRSFVVVVAAVVVLLAGAAVAIARDWDDERDSGPNAHQTELDQEFARRHATIVRGTPAGYDNPYVYVQPHRPTAKRRHPLAQH